MTERKSFKRAVRARMAKTGERYTAARRHLDHGEPSDLPPSEADPVVSDDSLHNATGKSATEWFAILDAWGAIDRPHRDIARYLLDDHDVPGWWAQTITVSYERARKGRAKYQRDDGTFAVNASKTVDVSVAVLFDAVVDAAARERWFPNAPLELRTSQREKSARFDWEDGATRVNMGFTAKSKTKSSVAVAHERLRDAREAELMKAQWKERLDELKNALES